MATPPTDYDSQQFRIPQEGSDYKKRSDCALASITAIIKDALEARRNKIHIYTNLKCGLPMENINKVAGPFIEAWASEIFLDVKQDPKNIFALVDVQAKERLYMADVVIEFTAKPKNITAEIDVKATAEDFDKSGRSPNITSYARIRTAYVQNPDYIFIILSLKHKVYSKCNKVTKMMEGIMEVVDYSVYDLKYLSSGDISYNPALGTGQLQVRDIHHVTLHQRTTWEFCKLLDQKYLASSKRSFSQWKALAVQHSWLRDDGPVIDIAKSRVPRETFMK